MITTFERATCKALQADVIEALKSVATKHGIQFAYKGGSFNPSNFTFRIEAAVVGAGGVVETREHKDFVMYAPLYQLKAEWLDKTFDHSGDTFTIIGFSTRKRKNPVLCKSKNTGKTYVFATSLIKLFMEKQEQQSVKKDAIAA